MLIPENKKETTKNTHPGTDQNFYTFTGDEEAAVPFRSKENGDGNHGSLQGTQTGLSLRISCSGPLPWPHRKN